LCPDIINLNLKDLTHLCKDLSKYSFNHAILGCENSVVSGNNILDQNGMSVDSTMVDNS